MLVPACGRACRARDPHRRRGRLRAAGPRVGRLQFPRPVGDARLLSQPGGDAGAVRDGWLDSGDFAYTVEGEIYLTGRVKDLIIRGGRNLYPYELEQAVGNMPGVRKGCVAVFASNDPVNASERLVVWPKRARKRPRARRCGRRSTSGRRRDRHAGRRNRAGAAEFGAQDFERQDPAQRLARRLRARPDRRPVTAARQQMLRLASPPCAHA
jgi:acyl-CoA synthetase (AMP-forming)/AMP-acid ligase II